MTLLEPSQEHSERLGDLRQLSQQQVAGHTIEATFDLRQAQRWPRHHHQPKSEVVILGGQGRVPEPQAFCAGWDVAIASAPARPHVDGWLYESQHGSGKIEQIR